MFRKSKEISNMHKSSKDVLLTYIKEELNGTIPDIYNNTQKRIIIKQKNKEKKNSTTTIIIIIIVLILLLVPIIYFIYKKKNNSKGKLSSTMENINDNLLPLQ